MPDGTPPPAPSLVGSPEEEARRAMRRLLRLGIGLAIILGLFVGIGMLVVLSFPKNNLTAIPPAGPQNPYSMNPYQPTWTLCSAFSPWMGGGGPKGMLTSTAGLTAFAKIYADVAHQLGVTAPPGSNRIDPRVRASDLLWCWPADSSGVPLHLDQSPHPGPPFPLAPGTAAYFGSMYGETTDEAAISTEVAASSAPDEAVTVGLSLMEPIAVARANPLAAGPSPSFVSEYSLHLLGLTSINGRLAALDRKYGPFEFHVGQAYQICDLHLHDSKGQPIVIRFDPASAPTPMASIGHHAIANLNPPAASIPFDRKLYALDLADTTRLQGFGDYWARRSETDASGDGIDRFLRLHWHATMVASEGHRGLVQNSEVLQSPLLWYWPVDEHGNPYPLAERISDAQLVFVGNPRPTTFGVRRNAPSELQMPRPSLFSGGNPPSPFGTQVVEVPAYNQGTDQLSKAGHVGEALLDPLARWVEGEDRYPRDYAQVLTDLRLRPLTGRLSAVNREYGPIEVFRDPNQPVIEIHLGRSADPTVVRWDGTNASGPAWEVQQPGGPVLTPASAQMEPWFTLEESAVGRTILVDGVNH